MTLGALEEILVDHQVEAYWTLGYVHNHLFRTSSFVDHSFLVVRLFHSKLKLQFESLIVFLLLGF